MLKRNKGRIPKKTITLYNLDKLDDNLISKYRAWLLKRFSKACLLISIFEIYYVIITFTFALTFRNEFFIYLYGYSIFHFLVKIMFSVTRSICLFTFVCTKNKNVDPLILVGDGTKERFIRFSSHSNLIWYWLFLGYASLYVFHYIILGIDLVLFFIHGIWNYPFLWLLRLFLDVFYIAEVYLSLTYLYENGLMKGIKILIDNKENTEWMRENL